MVPVELYDVYCYAEDSVGHPASLKLVLATRTTVQTACCKPIVYVSYARVMLYVVCCMFRGMAMAIAVLCCCYTPHRVVR
jgi:hypothetical protein